MYLEQFFVEGLGHASYVIASESSHEAAVIDPRRDVQIYRDAAAKIGATLRYAIETHDHNDFVSGARILAETDGVEVIASAGAGLQYPHRGVRAGDALTLGELGIRILETPGHTPEHVSYVVTDHSRSELPIVAFTGGDLLVGSVGRPDLLGAALGRTLAPQLYDSLHEQLLRLEDYVEVLPTHGAGSLCGRGISGKRTSTIGYERRSNPALLRPNKDDFVRYVLSGDPTIPAYYARMRTLNQAGATGWQLPPATSFTARELERLLAAPAAPHPVVLDVRAPDDFAQSHLPSALNVGAGPMLPTWVGSLLPHDTPLVLVLDDPAQWGEIVTGLARIGHELILGYLEGGVAGWRDAGLPLDPVARCSVDELAERLRQKPAAVLDVRTDAEWDDGHIAGARHIPLNDLPGRISEVPVDRTVSVICGSGYRSIIAASLLLRAGRAATVDTAGGMGAWYAAGHPTTTERSADPHIGEARP
ncbi:MAG: MBL fold metallo-hydrolase [Candidatus Limnocylindrales bacterium]